MKKLFAAAIMIMAMVSNASAQENDAFNAVQKLFAAMSAYDYDGMFEAGTDDFQLLEDGEVWDMQMLADAVRGGEGKVARRNFFAVIKTVTTDDNIWISYWNKAIFSVQDEEDVSVAWLESVVVVFEDGKWKVEMMHSTNTRDVSRIPDNVVLEEYIGTGAYKIAN